MTESPETRLSLIVRLKDRRDREAWGEFLEIYRPLVYRLALAKGLQHADAEDVAQQVFGSVARAVDRWQPDAEREAVGAASAASLAGKHEVANKPAPGARPIRPTSSRTGRPAGKRNSRRR